MVSGYGTYGNKYRYLGHDVYMIIAVCWYLADFDVQEINLLFFFLLADIASKLLTVMLLCLCYLALFKE